MSRQENERVKVVRDILTHRRTQTDEARRLKVTTRCIRYWVAAFEAEGAKGLVHGNRGKESSRRVPKKERKKIISLIRSNYVDFGPTFASEKLSELHGISRDPKTIRSIMIEEKIWTPGKKDWRVAATHRSWRERRARRGELVQFDGSYHDWFEGRGGHPELCLLAAIDDATGELLWAQFAEHEGTLPVMRFFTEYARMHGLPASIYLDRFSTYKMTQDVAVQNPDLKTQLQRAMKTLGVELIFALSPQAKGRVERLFKTLQDRLVKELRLRNISSVEEANLFLEHTYISAYTKKYCVEPREKVDAHRPLTKRELDDLPNTLCRLHTRVIQNDFTCSFEGQWYQLLKTARLAIRPKESAVVRQFPDSSVTISVREKRVNIELIEKRTHTCFTSCTRIMTTLVPVELSSTCLK